jgi:hypothetical protein
MTVDAKNQTSPDRSNRGIVVPVFIACAVVVMV